MLSQRYRFWLARIVVGAFLANLAHQPALAKESPYKLANYSQAQYQQAIMNYYRQAKPASKQQRIVQASEYFLGKPYSLGALGEGKIGKIDQSPFYRTDKFDCLTYVSTVLALANSNNINKFEKNLVQIRYKQGQRSYIARNHFVSIDWNNNNGKQGYIRDITTSIIDENGQSSTKIASAYINKKQWYKNKGLKNIKLLPPTNQRIAQQRLALVHNYANKVENKQSNIAYIPFSKLVSANGKLNYYLLEQIPNGSIVEIVRPNWQPPGRIGTRLNVTHIGFLIKKGDGAYFRHVSIKQGKVVDVPLERYISIFRRDVVRGVNIQKIL
jgi:hypothetical protein